MCRGSDRFFSSALLPSPQPSSVPLDSFVSLLTTGKYNKGSRSESLLSGESWLSCAESEINYKEVSQFAPPQSVAISAQVGSGLDRLHAVSVPELGLVCSGAGGVGVPLPVSDPECDSASVVAHVSYGMPPSSTHAMVPESSDVLGGFYFLQAFVYGTIQP